MISLSFWSAPLTIFVFAVALQTLSHIAEPDIPPRASASEDWVPIGEYFRGPPTGRRGPLGLLARVGRAVASLVFGCFDEVFGSPRLLPIVVLNGLWAAGYQRAQRDELKAIVGQALRSGNPAIDVIGLGGVPRPGQAPP